MVVQTRNETTTKNRTSPEGRFCGGAECQAHRTTVHGGYIVRDVIWILG
jgi:hypothetical protein